MYRGTPAQFFFQCVNLSHFPANSVKGSPAQILGWVCIVIFKQLITNLGIHCDLKMSGCQSFCGFMTL